MSLPSRKLHTLIVKCSLKMYTLILITLATASTGALPTCDDYCKLSFQNKDPWEVGCACPPETIRTEKDIVKAGKTTNIYFDDTGIYYEPVEMSPVSEVSFVYQPFVILNPTLRSSSDINKSSFKKYNFNIDETNDNVAVPKHRIKHKRKNNVINKITFETKSLPIYLDVDVNDPIDVGRASVKELQNFQNLELTEQNLMDCIDLRTLVNFRLNQNNNGLNEMWDNRKLQKYFNWSYDDLMKEIQNKCSLPDKIVEQSLHEIKLTLPKQKSTGFNTVIHNISTNPGYINNNFTERNVMDHQSSINIKQNNWKDSKATTISVTPIYSMETSDVNGLLSSLNTSEYNVGQNSNISFPSYSINNLEVDNILNTSKETNNNISSVNITFLYTEDTTPYSNNYKYEPDYPEQVSENSNIEIIKSYIDKSTEFHSSYLTAGYDSFNISTKEFNTEQNILPRPTEHAELNVPNYLTTLNSSYNENNTIGNNMREYQNDNIDSSNINKTLIDKVIVKDLSPSSDIPNRFQRYDLNLEEPDQTSTNDTFRNNRTIIPEAEMKIRKVVVKEYRNSTVVSEDEGDEQLPNNDFINSTPDPITDETDLNEASGLLGGNETFTRNLGLPLFGSKEYNTEYVTDKNIINNFISLESSEITGNIYFLFDKEHIPARFVQKQDGKINIGIHGPSFCDKISDSNNQTNSTLLKILCDHVKSHGIS